MGLHVIIIISAYLQLFLLYAQRYWEFGWQEFAGRRDCLLVGFAYCRFAYRK